MDDNKAWNQWLFLSILSLILGAALLSYSTYCILK